MRRGAAAGLDVPRVRLTRGQRISTSIVTDFPVTGRISHGKCSGQRHAITVTDRGVAVADRGVAVARTDILG